MADDFLPTRKLAYEPHERPKQHAIRNLAQCRVKNLSPEACTEALWHMITFYYFPPAEGYVVWILHSYLGGSEEEEEGEEEEEEEVEDGGPTFMFRVERVCETFLERSERERELDDATVVPSSTRIGGDSAPATQPTPMSTWVAFIQAKPPGADLDGQIQIQLEEQIDALMEANALEPFPNVNRKVGGVVASGGKARFFVYECKREDRGTWERHAVVSDGGGGGEIEEVDVVDVVEDYEAVHRLFVQFKCLAEGSVTLTCVETLDC